MSTRSAAAAASSAHRKVVKPTPAELMEDTGTGLDYGTRPDRMPGYLTPTDRFFIRSHAPTPHLTPATWTLQVEGNGVRKPIAYTYDDLWNRFPHVSITRTIECAGNRRVLFGAESGRRFEGTQWGRGAISTAEWTGVRLRDLLEPSGITPDACEVMPEVARRDPRPPAAAAGEGARRRHPGRAGHERRGAPGRSRVPSSPGGLRVARRGQHQVAGPDRGLRGSPVRALEHRGLRADRPGPPRGRARPWSGDHRHQRWRAWSNCPGRRGCGRNRR